MTDARLISPPERAALTAWSRDLQQCGSQVIATMMRDGLSSYVPILLASRDRQDQILVLLAQRKIPWGEAVLRLRASRTALLKDITEKSDWRSAEFSRSTETTRANVTALLNALTRLVP